MFTGGQEGVCAVVIVTHGDDEPSEGRAGDSREGWILIEVGEDGGRKLGI